MGICGGLEPGRSGRHAAPAAAPHRGASRTTTSGTTVRGVLAAVLAGLVVTTLAPPAKAEPATPLFVRHLDGYADYDGQRTCADHLQPGVDDFRTLILAAYPGTYNASDVRECTAGVSEHKDGRAWDWGIPQGYQDDAEELLSWLLATDAYGNRHALMRRLGIMYMIWNRQIFEAWDADAGWQPYDGGDPHTSHVHFSFAWDGALEETSWFTGQEQGMLLDQAAYGATWRDRERLDVVRLSPSGAVEQRTRAGSQWDDWHSLGGDLVSAPVGAWTSTRSYWVFGVDSGEQVTYARWKEGRGWSSWRHFGKTVTSAVDVSAGRGRIDLAVRNKRGAMLYRSWMSKKHAVPGESAVKKAGWARWENAGGFTTAPPTLVRTGGMVTAFVRGGTGLIHQSTRLGADDWTAWQPIGGPTSSGPDVSVLGVGALTVTVRGPADETQVADFEGGTWTWASAGGVLSSGPESAARSRHRLDVLVRGTDGRLWMNHRKDGTWAGWGAAGRVVVPPPPALLYPPPAVVDPEEPYEPGSEIEFEGDESYG